jgi:hypothetical protein
VAPAVAKRAGQVATSTALLVCSRFSAWSKMMLAGDSNTSPGHFEAGGHAGVIHDFRPKVVFMS